MGTEGTPRKQKSYISPSASSVILTNLGASTSLNQNHKGHRYSPSATFSEKEINQLSVQQNNTESAKDHRQYTCLQWTVNPKIMV